MSLWKKSQCRGSWLHNFLIIKEYQDCVKEACEKCHKVIYFKIRNGTVNNYEYLNHHLRSVLQPYHSRFKKEYPQHG